MNRLYPLITLAVFILAIQSCSKKNHPSPAVVTPAPVVIDVDSSLAIKKNDSLATVKPVVKKKVKESVPKVIVVNDKYASKSVDGRYFYDLQGHRYWRSNKDGKYYLFNKSMLTDDDFKKPN